MMSSDTGVSNGYKQKRSVGAYASDIEGHTRTHSTPPMVRKAPTAAIARASLSDCVEALRVSSLEGRINLAARNKNDQQSHSE